MTANPPPIAKIAITQGDLVGWGAATPLAMRFALGWAKWMPRGKGWVPRAIGRRFGKHWRAVVRSRNGLALAVDPIAFDSYSPIAANGDWDESVLQTCLAILAPGDVFYDIGANVGYMSLSVAHASRGEVEVHGFEPQPSLAFHAALSAPLNDLPNVSLYSCMLGETAGYADLYLSDHSIHASGVMRGAGTTKISCPMYRMDDLVASGAIPPPTLIKIDVEGAELHVLRGASALLRQHAPHITFETDMNADRFGYGRKDLLDFLRSLTDYRFMAIEVGPNRLRMLNAADELDENVRDILAVPPNGKIPALAGG